MKLGMVKKERKQKQKKNNPKTHFSAGAHNICMHANTPHIFAKIQKKKSLFHL